MKTVAFDTMCAMPTGPAEIDCVVGAPFNLIELLAGLSALGTCYCAYVPQLPQPQRGPADCEQVVLDPTNLRSVPNTCQDPLRMIEGAQPVLATSCLLKLRMRLGTPASV